MSMNIGHLIAQFYPVIGGAEICVHNVCSALARDGGGATVVTTTPAGSVTPDLPYAIERLHSRTCGLLGRYPRLGRAYLHHKLGRLQRRHQFDLWQVTMGYPLGVHAVEFFRRHGIPCILRCCGEDIQRVPEIGYGYRLDPAIDALARHAYPRFDGLVALTPSVRQEYLDLGVAASKIRIISNGVDVARFQRTRPNREKLATFGVGPDTVVILTVGRHHPKKGYDQIPRIAQRLKDGGFDFRWLIVGRGHEDFTRRFPEATSLGIHTLEDQPVPSTGNVDAAAMKPSGLEIPAPWASGSSAVLPGASRPMDATFNLPSDTLVELYRSADIFAFPTLLETFGMVLVEAMAAGLPVVTTDAPGVRDVITNGENGLQSPAGDADAFAVNLERLLADPLERARYRELSLAAAGTYNWPRVVEQYRDFYRHVLDNIN
jgi:glycosyltransferase involved in cell wall biosynthesis